MATGHNHFLQGIGGKIGSIVVVARGTQTIVRPRTYVSTSNSPAQQTMRGRVSDLSHLWRTLTAGQCDAWRALGARMAGTKSGRPLTCFQAFTAINGLRLSCGLPGIEDAPDAPSAPPPLPPLALDVRTGSEGQPLALALVSAGYAGLVQVYATPPLSAGRNSFRKFDYKLLAVLPALMAGETLLGELYAARFGVPPAGRRIGVRVVPVSDDGFRGQSISVHAEAHAGVPTLSTFRRSPGHGRRLDTASGLSSGYHNRQKHGPRKAQSMTLQLSSHAEAALHTLAARRAQSPQDIVEALVRRAAQEDKELQDAASGIQTGMADFAGGRWIALEDMEAERARAPTEQAP